MFTILLSQNNKGISPSKSTIQFAKLKTKTEGEFLKSKLRLYSDKLGVNYKKRRGQYNEVCKCFPVQYSKHYIEQITVTIKNVPVLDIQLSPFLFSNPKIEFKSRDVSNANSIQLLVRDNSKKTSIASFKIKRDHKKNGMKSAYKASFKQVHVSSKAWNSTTIGEAIKEVYGTSLKKSKNKRHFLDANTTRTWFCKNEVCMHDTTSPINIVLKSNRKLESISIFSSNTEKALLAVLTVPENGFVDVEIPFQIDREGKVLIVAKDRNGKLYQTGYYTITTNANYESEDLYLDLGFNLNE